MRTLEHKNMRVILLTIFVFGFLALVLPIKKVEAAGRCLCIKRESPECISALTASACFQFCGTGTATFEADDATCDAAVRSTKNASTIKPTAGQTQPTQDSQVQSSTLSGWIEKCGRTKMDDGCYNVTVFISLALDLVKYLFGIIGGVALLFFVYGGFVFILSQGSPDRITHGKAVLVSAVIGIVIAFSGYALVRFLGDVVGIKSDFTLNK